MHHCRPLLTPSALSKFRFYRYLILLRFGALDPECLCCTTECWEKCKKYQHFFCCPTHVISARAISNRSLMLSAPASNHTDLSDSESEQWHDAADVSPNGDMEATAPSNRPPSPSPIDPATQERSLKVRGSSSFLLVRNYHERLRGCSKL